MSRVAKLRVLAPLAIGVSVLGSAAAIGGQTPLTSASGIYTEAQAAEGKALYKDACASCHGDNLMGTFETPTLNGRFVRNWSGKSVGALFSYVSDAMPQMGPGSLSPEDNSRIVAYLLKENGMPAGAKPLPDDRKVLTSIAFVPPPAAP